MATVFAMARCEMLLSRDMCVLTWGGCVKNPSVSVEMYDVKKIRFV